MKHVQNIIFLQKKARKAQHLLDNKTTYPEQYILLGITCTHAYLWGVHIMKKYN